MDNVGKMKIEKLPEGAYRLGEKMKKVEQYNPKDWKYKVESPFQGAIVEDKRVKQQNYEMIPNYESHFQPRPASSKNLLHSRLDKKKDLKYLLELNSIQEKKQAESPIPLESREQKNQKPDQKEDKGKFQKWGCINTSL